MESGKFERRKESRFGGWQGERVKAREKVERVNRVLGPLGGGEGR